MYSGVGLNATVSKPLSEVTTRELPTVIKLHEPGVVQDRQLGDNLSHMHKHIALVVEWLGPVKLSGRISDGEDVVMVRM